MLLPNLWLVPIPTHPPAKYGCSNAPFQGQLYLWHLIVFNSALILSKRLTKAKSKVLSVLSRSRKQRNTMPRHSSHTISNSPPSEPENWTPSIRQRVRCPGKGGGDGGWFHVLIWSVRKPPISVIVGSRRLRVFLLSYSTARGAVARPQRRTKIVAQLTHLCLTKFSLNTGNGGFEYGTGGHDK